MEVIKATTYNGWKAKVCLFSLFIECTSMAGSTLKHPTDCNSRWHFVFKITIFSCTLQLPLFTAFCALKTVSFFPLSAPRNSELSNLTLFSRTACTFQLFFMQCWTTALRSAICLQIECFCLSSSSLNLQAFCSGRGRLSTSTAILQAWFLSFPFATTSCRYYREP